MAELTLSLVALAIAATLQPPQVIAMVILLRWWIESYRDTRRIFDKVHAALQHALDEVGIGSPFPTQKLNLQVRSEMGESISQAL